MKGNQNFSPPALDVAAPAAAFAQTLVDLFGQQLAAVVLYGSAARGEYQPGVSDLNLLVLLHGVDVATLQRCSAAARAWVKEGNPPPLLLDVEEWRRSADVFAVEYSDMAEAHQMVHGEDPFGDVSIHPEHLRLQCERELKGKLIQLREHLLLASATPEALSALLQRSLSTFLVLFRAALRLDGGEVPRQHHGVITAAAARAGFASEPLLAILRARGGETKLNLQLEDSVVVGYLAAIQRVADWVDGLQTTPLPARAPSREQVGQTMNRTQI